ncbi:MAG TPA: hypothetical protein VHO24_00435 [Opitutaceae bacterium]|nr:hypothetical protein [Opitutaceae bacterium]
MGTHDSMQPFNQSRRERALRPKKPEFAMTGVVIGLIAGWLVGFGAEIILHQKMIVMLLGGVAGALLGGGFEAIRFWWRMHRFREAKKSIS